jgi:hypothetical protein
VAVQLTVLLPTLPVLGVPQLCEARSEAASLAPGVAVAVPLRSTGSGETVGLSMDGVASRLIVTLSLPVPPALVALQVYVVAA